MLLRYKPCWETYGEEGSEEGRKRGRKEGRKEVMLHQTCTSAQKKSVVCRDEWSSDYLPRDARACLKIAEWRFKQV